jgi:cytochrome c5
MDRWWRRWWKHFLKFLELKTWWSRAVAIVLVLILITVVSNYLSNIYAFWDDAPDRGAVVVKNDVFGDKVSNIVYLDGKDDPTGQGWAPKDTLWFDNTTQGSDLVPYDFFLVLRRKGSNELIRSDENMNNRYRYLPRHATYNNPDALPVGMVKDNYLGKNFMGFTCAACHTGQINYNGTGIRIDGAPAMADMDTFLDDLSAALNAAQYDPKVQAQFVNDVMAIGHYKSADDVKADLKTYSLRLTAYRIINKSDTHYGFARLDAFGRIFNQVLEYVANPQDVQAVVNQLIAGGKITQTQLDKGGFSAVLNGMLARVKSGGVLNGTDRDHLMESLGTSLSLKQLLQFRNKMFNAPDAPVSYPFLWDIPQHDYVQWNGVVANAGLGPIGRNTGEVIGVFGTMNWSRSNHWTPEGVISGQGLFNTQPINFSSSVNVHNLGLLEDHLKSLRSPVWPQDILPKIDQAKAARGRVVFDTYCATCHANIERTDPNRRIVASMTAQDVVGTDAMMSQNSAGYRGYSGILRNQYIGVGPGDLLLNQRAAVAALLTYATTAVVATPDATKWFGQRFVEWAYDLIFSLRNNGIQPSMKGGNYHPDTTADPLASIRSYKGRALDGIWATAPYLHNGSVPTLYDLLLPAQVMPGDPAGMTYRPTKFMMGSREFDPVKVGFKTDGYQGFAFNTDPLILGNSNLGHEYGTRDRTLSNGTVQPALTDNQRWDLVEYLKTL